MFGHVNISGSSSSSGVTLDMIYPVGSIYMSVNSTNPSILFGGTWEAWGAGKVVTGINANDTKFDTVEKTGGASSVSLRTSNMPSHNHSVSSHSHSIPSHSHTMSPHDHSIPSHSHSINSFSTNTNGSHEHYGYYSKGAIGSSGNMPYLLSSRSGTGETSDSITTLNGGDHKHTIPSHNTNSGGSKYTDITNIAVGYSGTLTSETASPSTSYAGSGSSFSVMQPYITCYMWKRTA